MFKTHGQKPKKIRVGRRKQENNPRDEFPPPSPKDVPIEEEETEKEHHTTQENNQIHKKPETVVLGRFGMELDEIRNSVLGPFYGSLCLWKLMHQRL